MWSLNRGGLIIEVVAHAGLTVRNERFIKEQ